MKKAPVKTIAPKPGFDPTKDYQWKESDVFDISGKEFEIIHNTLNTLFSTGMPEPQMYVMFHAILQITTNILKRNVENGKIVPKA